MGNEICLKSINVNNQTVVNLVQKQNELVNLRNEKIEGVMLRSKCRYMDLGEKPTNYFFLVWKLEIIQVKLSIN